MLFSPWKVKLVPRLSLAFSGYIFKSIHDCVPAVCSSVQRQSMNIFRIHMSSFFLLQWCVSQYTHLNTNRIYFIIFYDDITAPIHTLGAQQKIVNFILRVNNGIIWQFARLLYRFGTYKKLSSSSYNNCLLFWVFFPSYFGSNKKVVKWLAISVQFCYNKNPQFNVVAVTQKII